jgi:hypothetical protein
VAYSIYLALTLATTADAGPQSQADSDDFLDQLADRLRALLHAFAGQPVDPTQTAAFERQLQQLLRDCGRQVVEYAYNRLEPQDPGDAPRQVRFEHLAYRRLKRKTPRAVSTLFGDISLRRLGYRDAQQTGEPLLFPLERQLGVVHGTSPALRERLAWHQAQAGATQRSTLMRLKADHGVALGVRRLRQVVAWVAEALAEHTPVAQAEQLLSWLHRAQTSQGRRRVVLSVGRDGVTVGLRRRRASVFQVAATATVAVYDRRGRRLGTVYLACPPQAGQAELSRRLTELLLAVLRGWSGRLPRLAYVTDAGSNETAYYDTVLRQLTHPVTGERLRFVRVVDFYHACSRVSTIAASLFGEGVAARSWAQLMRKDLCRRGGLERLLGVVESLRGRLGLSARRRERLDRAVRYLKKRRRYLRFAEYRRLGIPLGSGVTEAGCKTVFTQRLKLSGMRWTKVGAEWVLQLRVAWLSGIWEVVQQRLLHQSSPVLIPTPWLEGEVEHQVAA